MILLTLDTSNASQEAARVALDLSQKFNQPLGVLLVLDGPLRHHFGELGRETGEDPEELAEQFLNESVVSLTGDVSNISLYVRHAMNAGTAIVQCAQEAGASLIVMATHGRSGISRFLAGSVTSEVIRESSIPVVAVPVRKQQS